MAHRDFEEYAQQKLMRGPIAQKYIDFFKANIDLSNNDLKVMDYGCGDGRYFSFFCQYFKKDNIYGIEVSMKRVQRCKEIGFNNAIFLKALDKLPFTDNFFDFINFDQVIEHIPFSQINFYLEELMRVLKPGGKVILITPNYPVKRIYDLTNAIIKLDLKRPFDDPTHITKYNFNKLKNLLSCHFSDVHLRGTGGFLYNIFKNERFHHKIIGLLTK